MLATGLTTLADVLQTVPQVQNNPNSGGSGPVYRQGGTSGYGGNTTQGTSINLRGLGTSATLTLVDGRRVVPSGAASTFTEAIQVPIAAVERIEVVTDGSSAIYGSDAISGVVNYVLRKNFNGIEISGRDTVNRYYNTWGTSVTAGKSWSTGNVILTYDYEFRDSFYAGKSKYLRQDLTSLGGPDSRANNGTVSAGGPTLITGGTGAPYTYYTIPDGSGTGLSFTSLTEGGNLVDASDYNEYLGKQKRHQVALFFNQEINSSLNFYVEAFYTKRDTSTRSYNNTLTGNNVTVCEDSPYYITDAPAGASSSSSNCGGGMGQLVAVNASVFFNGSTVTKNPAETISVTAGYTGKLPGSWTVETYFTYAHDSTCGICNYGNNANMSALAAEIQAGRINPYSTTPLTDAQYATFMGDNLQFSYNSFYDAVTKFNGPLFSLPAGEVKVALGGELAYNRQHLINGSNTAYPDDPTNNSYAVTNDSTVHRSTASAFAELFIPVIGSDMNIPLMQELNVNAAVRYDDYSDFGDTTNPKIGATWMVNDAVSIRGSWGTSFRAPSLTDTNPMNFSAALAGVPFANNSGRTDIGILYPGFSSAYQIIGANSRLKPETATSWSAGIDIKPVGSGFRFSATYYNMKYTNQIVAPTIGLFLSSPENAALYSQYIIPVNNPGTCVNGDPSTYDPVLANFIAANPALYRISIFGACSVNVILDGRSANAATTYQDGLDFQANYMTDSSIGRWNLGLNVTKILNQKLQTVVGGKKQDVLDTYYYPVSLRGRAQIGWSLGRVAANLFVNYVGSYTNTIPLSGQPQSKVPSWTTADMGITYSVPPGGSALGGLRLAVNVQNLTNEDPPLVLTQSGTSYSAFDASNASIYGRTVSIQITKAF